MPIKKLTPLSISEYEDTIQADAIAMSDTGWEMYQERMKTFMRSKVIPAKAKFYIHNTLVTMRGYRSTL